MKITPTSLSISQLFGSANERFFVPAYQRRYSWGKKQIAEFFEDINLLKEQDFHFLGTVVCLIEDYKAGINTLELVDGQQRITTLTLLLKALRDRFHSLGDDGVVQEIDAYLCCKGVDRKPIGKVLLGDLDDPDYARVMKQEELDQVANQRLKDGYVWLSEWLSQFDLPKLHAYYFKLINNVATIRLDVGQAKDAYKLFETINNRGLALSPTDIIKNFLLGHASVLGDETLTKVKKNWKEIIINLDGIDTDDFFRQYMCYVLTRRVYQSVLIDEFKKHYFSVVKEAEHLAEYELYTKADFKAVEPTDDDSSEPAKASEGDVGTKRRKKVSIIQFSAELKKAADTYRKINKVAFVDKRVNRHLHNLRRIKAQPTYIFLFSLFERDLDDKVIALALRLLESFMMRRHICEYRTAELDDIFSALVGIKGKDVVVEIKKRLRQHLPDDELFRESFCKFVFKGGLVDRAKYALETIEYHLANATGEYVLNSGNDVHLEHIIPQTIDTKKAKREFGDWMTYLGSDVMDKHPLFVNRIGNFTLLGQKFNIKASNNPYHAKLVEYRKSQIELTASLASTSFRKCQYS